MQVSRVALLALSFAAHAGGASAQMGRRPLKEDKPALTRQSTEPSFPFGANWVLKTFNGKPVGGESPSFTLDEKLRATGFSGCNSFSLALYPIRDQKLAAGAIALTHKTCDPAIMASERAFLVGLHSLPHWEVATDGDLTLKGATGVMQFRRGI